MANMDNFKVYLRDEYDITNKVHRFTIETHRGFNYEGLREKIKSVFPVLSNKSFTLSWKDSEEDVVLITNDDDLKLALDETRRLSEGSRCLYKIYVAIQSESERDDDISLVAHPDVVCDECCVKVYGFRYKCLQCENYDLCQKCEALGVHAQHCMLRTPRFIQLNSRSGRIMMHQVKKFLNKSDNNCSADDEDRHERRGKKHRDRCSRFDNQVIDWTKQIEKFANLPADCLLRSSDFSQILENFGIDIGVEIKPDNKESTSQTDTNKKKEKESQGTSTESDTAKKFPGEGRKLVDDEEEDIQKDDKENNVTNQETAQNDTPKVTSTNDDCATKTSGIGEWTIIHKTESPNISRASSASSSLNESTTKETTIYPKLPEEEKIPFPKHPAIQTALEIMKSMGFSNKGGFLTYLLEKEQGNINKVLDVLQSYSSYN